MLTLTANARNIYITPEADGTGDGSSWESPMMLTDYLVTATNSSVLKHGGVGAKGYTTFLAIPLKRFGLDGMTVESLVGKTINFDAEFYNAQYKETRYYEGPSKGDGLAGVIRLGALAPDKK
ncbi:MAG: hypothetical protein J6V38_07485 [Kiritimatiellae bacterium]|nr:hypothetical protein [Kiritimatiellia bacterium]